MTNIYWLEEVFLVFFRPVNRIILKNEQKLPQMLMVEVELLRREKKLLHAERPHPITLMIGLIVLKIIQ